MTNKEQFVADLYQVCLATERSIFEELREPSGKTSPSGVRRAEWYGSLSAKDQESLREMVRYAAQSTVFGVLAELDGVSSDVEYELRRRDGDSDGLVTEGDLHDLFRAVDGPVIWRASRGDPR
jgi:hypothetical protein